MAGMIVNQGASEMGREILDIYERQADIL